MIKQMIWNVKNLYINALNNDFRKYCINCLGSGKMYNSYNERDCEFCNGKGYIKPYYNNYDVFGKIEFIIGYFVCILYKIKQFLSLRRK
jgi:hypothetical protein